MSSSPTPRIAILGGGPAGLMAADVLASAGVAVDLYDAMPSLGRKLLRAGIGGLNITHSEPYERFVQRYAERQTQLRPLLDRFPPDALQSWVHSFGIETFVGSSGRVFPAEMKAAPLLRAWLHRLRGLGVRSHVRHRWQGWHEDGSLKIAHGSEVLSVRPQATVLALGGGSWPQLGSDGAWVEWLLARGVGIQPLQSANCGFELNWSDHLRDKFAGTPLKSVALSFTDDQGHTEQRVGELIITRYGVEGSLIYAFSRALRQAINAHGQARFTLDLAPGRDHERLLADLRHPRGTRSMSSHLQSRVGISGIRTALLFEVLSKDQWADPVQVAQAIKALPLTVHAMRPLAEAISTAGGVLLEDLNDQLMIKSLPGVFVAGEMLDWDAPTGGYLLNACLATGRAAGEGVLRWLHP